MAKKVVSASGKKKKKKSKKSGGGKGMLLLLLILLTLGGVGAYMYYDQILMMFMSDEMVLMEADDQNLQIEPEKVMDQPGKTSEGSQQALVETSQLRVPPPVVKVKTPRSGKRFYVKVGSCLYMECQENFTRGIKQNKFSVYKTKTRKQTQYFELISSSGYNRERANEKQKLLRKYNVRLQPYIIPSGGTGSYRISFGSFPDKNKALEMKSYLAQMFPQINMVFGLETRKNSYDITNIYAGPFSSDKKAQKARINLRKNSNFLDAFVTTKR